MSMNTDDVKLIMDNYDVSKEDAEKWLEKQLDLIWTIAEHSENLGRRK